MGGDCLNTGCVPSKALIRAATAAHEARHAAALGVDVTSVRVDFARVMDRVHRVVREIEPHDSVARYTGLGVDVKLGRARIVDPWHVEITAEDGRTETLATRAIVVATGARPIVPPLPGLVEAGVLTSDTLWDLRELPARLVVLGGGPIGCELAQAFARLGSQVTQVEMAPRLMGREDEDVSAFVQARLEADGVTVLTGHRALRCEHRDGNLSASGHEGVAQGVADEHHPVSVDTADESSGPGWELVVEVGEAQRRIPFDRIVCAVGRQARLEGFGLEELGLIDPAKPPRTLPVDEHLRTRVPTILGCGDVAGPYQFTHVAAHQAWYAAVNGLFGGLKPFKADYRVIPWCTFVDPEVARVGLNVQEARERGIAFELTRFELGELDRVIADRGAAASAGHGVDPTLDHGVHPGADGWVQVLTVPGKDRILGATIVGRHAGDLLAEFVLAMKHGLGLNKILGTIHTYPTLSEATKYAAGAWKRAHAPQGLLRVVQRFHDWRRG
jgi:pyruvate/2-oxoglutarate dehydrogenase complex dihydrolipoamide dehydrogenase (E3) component